MWLMNCEDPETLCLKYKLIKKVITRRNTREKKLHKIYHFVLLYYIYFISISRILLLKDHYGVYVLLLLKRIFKY